MTPDNIIALAKKRLKSVGNTNIDWNSLFDIVMDEIFTDREWKFSKSEFNYIHPQNTFEKRFNGTATEIALNKIIAIRYTTSYALIGGIPVPTTNSSRALDYKPLQEFREDYPDEQIDGTPECWTELEANDGSSGMQIGIFHRPISDAAVWVTGSFIPAYTIGASELPILPQQFHSMVIDGIVGYAAEELGQDSLSSRNFFRFNAKIKKLRLWDTRNPSHKMVIGGRGGSGKLKLFLPGDYPVGVGR